MSLCNIPCLGDCLEFRLAYAMEAVAKCSACAQLQCRATTSRRILDGRRWTSPAPPPRCCYSRELHCGQGMTTARWQGVKAKRRMAVSVTADADAATEEDVESSGSPKLSLLEEESVRQSVALLKLAAKTRKVAGEEVFTAIRTLEKSKLDPSNFLSYIGGTESPGRTWMLVFTSGAKVVREALKGGAGGGQYVPVTAVQNFDAADNRIENGVYLGALGYVAFQGKFSWKRRILAFTFTTVSFKVGSLGPFSFKISKDEETERVPTQKDPFFIWFYADDEIIVAKGRGGGVAYWCRCERVSP